MFLLPFSVNSYSWAFLFVCCCFFVVFVVFVVVFVVVKVMLGVLTHSNTDYEFVPLAVRSNYLSVQVISVRFI